MSEPDQIDMMGEEELRGELRKVLIRMFKLESALKRLGEDKFFYYGHKAGDSRNGREILLMRQYANKALK